MTSQPVSDSAFSRRARLYSLITKERLDRDVLTELLPDGAPHLYERELWDYKESLPTPPADADRQSKDSYELALSQIVKDAVSFYNSYGTADTLRRQLDQLAWMIRVLRDEGYGDLGFLSLLEDNRKYLAQRLAKYVSS